MSRLYFQDWSGYTTLADLIADPLYTVVLPGCSFDGATLYNGHKTLKYEGATALGPATLGVALVAGGFTRLWARVVWRPGASLYSITAPAPASNGPGIPVSWEANNATYTVSGGGYRPVAGSYCPTALSIKSDTTEDLIDTSAAGISLGDLQALDFHTDDILIEQYLAKGMFRVRTWRNDVLVHDAMLDIAGVDDWLRAATLRIDPLVYDADSIIHIGELTIWDAETDPDPYGHSYLWADSFDDTTFLDKQDYGHNDTINNDSLSAHGPGYLSSFRNGVIGMMTQPSCFYGKNLRTPENVLGLHGRYWPLQFPGASTVEREILSFRSNLPTGIEADNAVMCNIFQRADGYLVLRGPSGALLSTSPAPVATITGVYQPTQYQHFYIEVRFGATNGYLIVKKDGVDWWSALNIATASSDGAQCVSYTLGQSIIGSDHWEFYWDDHLMTRGIEFRVAIIDFLPPNEDGTNDGYAQTNPWPLSVNGGFPNYMPVYTNIDFEPDADFSMMQSPATGSGKRIGFRSDGQIQDIACGGRIAGLIPLANLEQTPGDPALTPHYKYYFKIATTMYSSSLFGELSTSFLTTLPYFAGCSPATGDSWDPTALPEYGVENFDCQIDVSEMGLLLVRVSPSNDIPPDLAGSGLSVHDDEVFKTIDPLSVLDNLQPKPVLALWARDNLVWRPVALSGGLVPYCPLGPVDLPFAEEFTGTTFNRRFWEIFDLDSSSVIKLDAGELSATVPPDNASFGSPAYCGLVTQRDYYFAGGTIQVEVTQAVQDITNAQHILGLSGFIEVFLRKNGLNFEFGKDPGSPTIWATSLHTGSFRWLRIVHNQTFERLDAYWSFDGITWNIFGSSPDHSYTNGDTWPVAFYVAAATDYPISAGITTPVKFDHFSTTAIPLV